MNNKIIRSALTLPAGKDKICMVETIFAFSELDHHIYQLKAEIC
jgi:hypothetical protein